MGNGSTSRPRSSVRRVIAPLAAAVVAVTIIGAAAAVPAAAAIDGAGAAQGAVFAQTSAGDDGGGEATEAPEADLTPTGSGSNVENVTTTEAKLRWVVIGLVAIAVVSAVLTLGFARHTSPRRRERLEREREQARAERLRAAAALAGLGAELSRVGPPVESPPAPSLERSTDVSAAPPVRRAQPPRALQNGAHTQAPRRRDPRPRPRRR